MKYINGIAKSKIYWVIIGLYFLCPLILGFELLQEDAWIYRGLLQATLLIWFACNLIAILWTAFNLNYDGIAWHTMVVRGTFILMLLFTLPVSLISTLMSLFAIINSSSPQ